MDGEEQSYFNDKEVSMMELKTLFVSDTYKRISFPIVAFWVGCKQEKKN
jgi:hypothetical protein